VRADLTSLVAVGFSPARIVCGVASQRRGVLEAPTAPRDGAVDRRAVAAIVHEAEVSVLWASSACAALTHGTVRVSEATVVRAVSVRIGAAAAPIHPVHAVRVGRAVPAEQGIIARRAHATGIAHADHRGSDPRVDEAGRGAPASSAGECEGERREGDHARRRAVPHLRLTTSDPCPFRSRPSRAWCWFSR